MPIPIIWNLLRILLFVISFSIVFIKEKEYSFHFENKDKTFTP